MGKGDHLACLYEAPGGNMSRRPPLAFSPGEDYNEGMPENGEEKA